MLKSHFCKGSVYGKFVHVTRSDALSENQSVHVGPVLEAETDYRAEGWPMLAIYEKRTGPGHAACVIGTQNRAGGAMIHAHFDIDQFYQALDQVRKARQMSWREIFHATGLSLVYPSQFRRRRKQGWKWNADSLAVLAVWSGLNLNAFIAKEGHCHESIGCL